MRVSLIVGRRLSFMVTFGLIPYDFAWFGIAIRG